MYLMQYLHQNTLFCWFSLETSRIGSINLKRREICHLPLPEAHVEWDHCDPDIFSSLLVHVAQLKPGMVLKSKVSNMLRRMRSRCSEKGKGF